MTTPCPQRFARSVLLLAVTIAVLPVVSASAQSAPCAEGGAPQSTCTFVDDVAPYDAFLELACTRNLMAGCGGAYACPGEAVLREDMAVHLERLYRGEGTAHVFTPADTCASKCTFADLTPSHCLAGWICQLYKDGITGGCPTGYCGAEAVKREQMAVFLSVVISWRLGETIPTSGLLCRAPGDCRSYACQSGGTSAFSDVTPNSVYCKFIHYIAFKGVTAGCGVWEFCPTIAIPREQMAVFLVASDNLISGTPVPSTNTCQ